MKAIIVGGKHDGERPELEALPDILHWKSEPLERHEIIIKNHDGSKEEFAIYTPILTPLGFIFRSLLNGYRVGSY